MNHRRISTRVFNRIRRTLVNHAPIEAGLRRLSKGRSVTDWRARLVPNHYQYPSRH